MKGYEENELCYTLKDQIRLEGDLENAKQRLALKHDFNLFDAFRIFEKYSSGYITKYDLEDGLAKLGIYGPRQEINLFMKRYDTNQDGRLRFSEFADALTPKDRVYANMLNERRSNYNVRNPEDAFSYLTKLDFTDLLKKMLRIEGQSEDIRKSVNRRPLFRISDAFEALDENKNGYLSKQEFGSLLEEHRLYASQKDLDLLFSKYDRDRDGRVSYSEFFNEILPKEGY